MELKMAERLWHTLFAGAGGGFIDFCAFYGVLNVQQSHNHYNAFF
jgi:hypothetical protein